MTTPTRSRRAFLRGGALALTALALLPALDPWKGLARGDVHVPPLDPARLRDLRGRRLRVVSPQGTGFAARLVAVDVRRPGRREIPTEQFSILLRTGLRETLPQDVYRVELPDGETHSLFLVPVPAGRRGVHYQACFARLV